MRCTRRACLLLVCVIAAAGCQPASSHESLLFVQVAQGGTMEPLGGDEYTLALAGVHPDVVYFTDRPARAAGSITNEQFLDRWSAGPGSFAEDPPNAALALRDRDDVVVVELRDPVRDGDGLRYTARLIDDATTFAPKGSRPGAVPRDLGHVVLFIDNLGMSGDPMNTPDNFGRLSGGGGTAMNGLRNPPDPMNQRDNFGRE